MGPAAVRCYCHLLGATTTTTTSTTDGAGASGDVVQIKKQSATTATQASCTPTLQRDQVALPVGSLMNSMCVCVC